MTMMRCTKIAKDRHNAEIRKLEIRLQQGLHVALQTPAQHTAQPVVGGEARAGKARRRASWRNLAQTARRRHGAQGGVRPRGAGTMRLTCERRNHAGTRRRGTGETRGTHLLERLAEVLLDILLHRAPAVELAVVLQHVRRHGGAVNPEPWPTGCLGDRTFTHFFTV